MPTYADPRIPWLKRGPSVFDSPTERTMRTLADLLGANDPVNTVMGMTAPVDAPGASGGLLGAVEKLAGKYPKLARTLAQFHASGEQPVYRAAGPDLRPEALQRLGEAKWPRGKEGRYADAVLTGADAEHVMQAIENVTKKFPSLKASMPVLEQALKGAPVTQGRWADQVVREPASGLILPTPEMIGRYARYGLYGEQIPANWGPLTQMQGAFGSGPEAAREVQLYADLWGAISPVNDPLTNTLQANRAYGRTLGPQSLAPMGEAEFSSPALGLGLPSRLPNVNRAMAGEPLHGPKVPRMAGMVAGTERLPPLDEHMTTASGGATGKWGSELPALREKVKALTGDEFKGPAGELRLNKLLSEGLIEMWEGMYPGRDGLTSMAATWEGVRSDKGIKSVGGPYDVLRRLGLDQPGAMQDPARIKAVSKKWPGGFISSGVLLPIVLDRWRRTTDGQPENADDRLQDQARKYGLAGAAMLQGLDPSPQ